MHRCYLYFKRYCFLLAILFCSNISTFSQEKTIKTISDSELEKLAQQYTLSKDNSLSISQRLSHASSFIKDAMLYQQDSLVYLGLMRKTRLLGQIKQYDSAIIYTHQLYDLAKQNDDSVYIAKAYRKLGLYHYNKNQLNKAFKFYNEAFKISRTVYDTLGVGKNLLQMSNIQCTVGDYSGSKTSAIDGLKYIEKTSDLIRISGLYHIISVANSELRNYREALKYNSKALALYKDSISRKVIGVKNFMIYKNTQANILADQKEYKKAISIFLNLLSNPALKKDKNEYARVLSNLGLTKWLENKENKESKALLIEARKIRSEINDVEGLIASNIHLTKYYLKKDKTKALQYAEAAFQNAKIIRNLASTIEALGFIFQLKEDTNEEAKVYDKVHHELLEINQQNREIYAVTKYENEKLASKNTVLQGEKNKIKTTAWFISVLLLISVVGAGYYYYRQYQYKKRFLQLVNAKDAPKEETQKNPVKNKTLTSSVISQEALAHLLNQLQKFEEQQGFLATNINAKDLSKSFGSNSSYLSMVVNTYKQKSISQYINDLRIDFAIQKLQSDAIFRKYTIKAIAQDVGFHTSENFAKKFYAKTGIYPSYFIKKLEEEEE